MAPVATVLLALLGGCAAFAPPPTDVDALRTQSTIPVVTRTHEALTSLPPPSGRMVAAVYAFKDQTGQYKPSPSNGLSTAVTQGADTILLKALLDSGWFIPVERASLQNLLTERKISDARSAETAPGLVPARLPPVAPADLIVEGSIVAYDFNTRSGGAGARLLGLGSSQQYREDQVTVNLRVVNIADGLILHSVNSTKRVFSRELNNGLFSFVDADRILELEAGYSYNEPAQLAVTDAIESALVALIGEGVLRRSWTLADWREIGNDAFARLLDEDERAAYEASERAAEAARRPTVAPSPTVPGPDGSDADEPTSREGGSTAPLAMSDPSSRADTSLRKVGSRDVGEPSAAAASPIGASTRPRQSLVLVGGFRRRADAESALLRVRKVVTGAKVALASAPHGRFFSIHVGPLLGRESVESVKESVRSIGFREPKVLTGPI